MTNTTSELTTKRAYAVCRVTGLSFHIQDELGISDLYSAIHPIASNPDKLYHCMRKHAADIAPAGIAAAILLRLHENELISHPNQEPEYTRGYIANMLAQEPRYELIRLFWAVYNSKAHTKRTPILINLTEVATYKSSARMMAVIWGIATQDFSKGDIEYNATQSTATWAKSSADRQTAKEQHAKGKQDPISARNRVSTNLKGLCDQGDLTFSPKKASFIARTLLPVYHNLTPKARIEIADDLEHIYVESIKAEFLDRDEALARSLEIVISLVRQTDNDPLELTHNEEW